VYDSGGSEDDTMIWVAVFGFLAGIISGMGIGGGTILIPALLFLQDMNQQQAQGINLIYFVPTAVIALITHQKNGNIEKKTAKSLIVPGLLGAICGAFLAVYMKAEVLRRCFGVFLFLMGLTEVFHKKEVISHEKEYKNKLAGDNGRKRRSIMDTLEFATIKNEFQQADLEKKIELYVNTPGLTTEQYKELLRMYPITELDRLDKALQ
jgi:uncharacterized membrane protein YfcA